MSVPTSYTEDQLKTFMVTSLADVTTVLGWTVATAQVVEAVYDALFAYFGGSGAIADATNVPKLRAAARVAVWRAAVGALAAKYDVTLDSQSFRRGSLLAQARQALTVAEREATALGVGTDVGVVLRVAHTDPYRAAAVDEYGTVAV